MKYLKKFEGRGRIKIKGNQVHVGDTNMPQFWSENPGYTPKKDIPVQKTGGIDITTLVPAPGTDYNYIVDPDDHLDQKEIENLIKPHIKKFNDFGFNPMNEKLGIVEGLEDIADEIIEGLKESRRKYGIMSYKRNYYLLETEWRGKEIKINCYVDPTMSGRSAYFQVIDSDKLEFKIVMEDLNRNILVHELKHLDRNLLTGYSSKISNINILNRNLLKKYQYLLKKDNNELGYSDIEILSDVIYYSNPDEFEAYFNEMYTELKGLIDDSMDDNEKKSIISEYLESEEIYMLYRAINNGVFDISRFFKNNRNANYYIKEIIKRVEEIPKNPKQIKIKIKTNKFDIFIDKISKFIKSYMKDEEIDKSVKWLNWFVNNNIKKNYPKFNRLYTLLM